MGEQGIIKDMERIKETFILIVFTLYSAGALNAFYMYGWNDWIPLFMGLTIMINWIVFLRKKLSLKAREAVYVCMVEICIVLYGAFVEEVTLLTAIFMAIVVITGLLGDVELLYITDMALAVLIGHYIFTNHGKIGADFVSFYQFLLQIVNIAVIEFVIHFWVSQKNRGEKRTAEIIGDLEEAQRSKDDFLANVSHEIRTPINTICGMSEVALAETDAAKVKASLRTIRSAGRSLTAIVGDILDFSELQAGKMELENEVYNIASVMNDVIQMSLVQKDGKPIDLVVDCDARLPRGLYGDEKKIRRVIMNFVNNAFKFTTEGSVSISVSSRKESYGINLCVEVRDTGIGIREENLENIFSGFSQVDTKRTRQEGGIGLGLALSQIIIKKMGGVITVKSKYGKGTSIKFVIPQKVVDERPIVSIKEREKINVAVYLNLEQSGLSKTRDEYTGTIMHMAEQLQVRCQMYPDLAALKRRSRMEKLTHVFISLAEYCGAADFFDGLSRNVQVVVVLGPEEMEAVTNPYIIRLAKPLYILPVAAILNGGYEESGTDSLTSKRRFLSPQTHVLVVDDNQMNLKVMEGLLKRYQIKVSTANSGPEALEKIGRKEFDFIFMDYMMPEMDGVEILHRIRNKAGSYYKNIPVIAVTANAVAGSREMFLQEGFSDFIEKPVESSVLERLLRRNIPIEKMQFVEMQFEKTQSEKIQFPADEAGRPNEPGQDGEKQDMTVGLETEAESEKSGLYIGDLDVEKGLLYCGGEEAYIEILKHCCTGGGGHIEKLESLFYKEDWKNYTIEVHALKSMMKSVGAMPLSEKAKQLELAGKDGDISGIKENHAAMITEYQRVLEEIRQALEMPEEETLDAAECTEIDEDTLQAYLEELEAAMYDFDEEKMLAVIGRLETCSYLGQPLGKAAGVARRKVEMSDYMSAVDGISRWKERTQKGGGKS